MPLTIEFLIPDKYLGAIDSHLASQVVNSTDPTTGEPVSTPVFSSPADYFSSIIAEDLAHLSRKYPSTDALVKIATIQVLKEEVENDRPSKEDLTPVK